MKSLVIFLSLFASIASAETLSSPCIQNAICQMRFPTPVHAKTGEPKCEFADVLIDINVGELTLAPEDDIAAVKQLRTPVSSLFGKLRVTALIEGDLVPRVMDLTVDAKSCRVVEATKVEDGSL